MDISIYRTVPLIKTNDLHNLDKGGTYFLVNYFLVIFGPVQTTDRQKAMHMSPPCNVHRWAQKSTVSLVVHDKLAFAHTFGNKIDYNYYDRLPTLIVRGP